MVAQLFQYFCLPLCLCKVIVSPHLPVPSICDQLLDHIILVSCWAPMQKTSTFCLVLLHIINIQIYALALFPEESDRFAQELAQFGYEFLFGFQNITIVVLFASQGTLHHILIILNTL